MSSEALGISSSLAGLSLMLKGIAYVNEKDSARWNRSPRERLIAEIFKAVEDNYHDTIKTDFILNKIRLIQNENWQENKEWVTVKTTLSIFLKNFSHTQLCKLQQKPLTIFQFIPSTLRASFNHSSLFSSTNADMEILKTSEDFFVSFDFTPLTDLAKEKTIFLIFQNFLKCTPFTKKPSKDIRDQFKDSLRLHSYDELLECVDSLQSTLKLLPAKFNLLLSRKKISHLNLIIDTRDPEPRRQRPTPYEFTPDSTKSAIRESPPLRTRPRSFSESSLTKIGLKEALIERLNSLSVDTLKESCKIMIGATPCSNLKLLTEIRSSELIVNISRFELHGFGLESIVTSQSFKTPGRAASLEKSPWFINKCDMNDNELFSFNSIYNAFFDIILTKFDPKNSFFHRFANFLKHDGKLIVIIDLENQMRVEYDPNKKSIFDEVENLHNEITTPIPLGDKDTITLAFDRLYKGGFKLKANDFYSVEPSVYICEAQKITEEELKIRHIQFSIKIVKKRIHDFLSIFQLPHLNILCFPNDFVSDLKKSNLNTEVMEKLHFPKVSYITDDQFISYFDIVYCSLNDYNWEDSFNQLNQILKTPCSLILSFHITENLLKTVTNSSTAYDEDLAKAQVDPEHFAFFSYLIEKMNVQGFDFKYQCIQSHTKPFYIVTTRKKRKIIAT